MSGEILGKYDETINLAFQSIPGLPYFGMTTPRICFLTAMRKLLEEMPERLWNLEREMLVWGVGDRLDLLPDNGDDVMDDEMVLVDHRDLGGFLGLVLPFEFKLKNESVAFADTIPVSCKVEIPSEKEGNHCEESDDYEEKFRMVVKRMLHEIREETPPQVRRRPTLSRTVDTAESLRKT